MAKTIKLDTVNLIEIKKSKFIGYTYFCEDVEKANHYLKELKLEHKKATHVCYAYIINSSEKASDDGEPQGTAGMPILDVIKKQKLENVLVAVVRYFGGIKLGAGGLVRAYSDTASQTITQSDSANLVKAYKCKTQLNYGEEQKLGMLKNTLGVYNVEVEYTDKLEITFSLESGIRLDGYNITKMEEILIRV